MTQSADRQALAGDTSDATGAQHPYDRAKVYIAYGYGLTGAGVKVGIVDSGFDLVNGQPKHNEFSSSGKITVLQSTAPLSSDAHGAHVSALAVGDRNGTAMQGVAYNASLFLGMAPAGDINSTASSFTSLFNEYVTDGVTISSNSYGVPINGNEASPWKPVKTSNSYEVTAKNALAYRDANGLTTTQMLANIQGQTPAAWTDAITAMRTYQQAGGVIVFANSNYGANDIAHGGKGLDDTDLMAALPLAVPELKGGWITVVNATSTGLANRYSGAPYVADATAKEGGIVLLSAQCGLAADFCLTMDGTQLYSASNTGVSSYTTQTGTSQATPQVAGMVALLREAFPTGSAADTAARLLYTADNTFFVNSPTASTISTASYTNANGTITGKVSNIWGHGFPDMQAALKPVGAVTVRSASGESMPVASLAKSITASSALGSSSALASTSFLSNDVLNGVFASNLSSAVTLPQSSALTQVLSDQSTAQDESAVSNGPVTLTFAAAAQASSQQEVRRVFRLSAAVSPSVQVNVGHGMTVDSVLGFASTAGAPSPGALSGYALEIPYLAASRAQQTWFASSARFGSVTATVAAFGAAAPRNDQLFAPSRAGQPRSSGQLVDVVSPLSSAVEVNFTLGRMSERNGFLGAELRSGGSGEAQTTLSRAAVRFRLAHRLSLRMSYSAALTNVASGTVLGRARGLVSDASAVSLDWRDVAGKNSGLSLSLSQPLSVRSGKATVNLPDGVTISAPGDYAYTYSGRTVSLQSTVRETQAALDFHRPLGDRLMLTLSGAAQRYPLGQEARPLGFSSLIGLRYSY